ETSGAAEFVAGVPLLWHEKKLTSTPNPTTVFRPLFKFIYFPLFLMRTNIEAIFASKKTGRSINLVKRRKYSL
ncbi:MAG: hypothetical protein ACN6PI_19105, partial [Sphingobacterium siyangense]